MNINLLDKEKNFNILLAGIISLIIGVGVARFAFTTLLPSMLDDFLTVTQAGILASINYVGYLSGAILTIFITSLNTKVKLFRFGLFLSVVTTLVLATTKDPYIWYVSRIIAGFGSAMVLIIGGALVMVKLNVEDKTKAMGYHFSGIGFAIFVCEIISQYTLKVDSWEYSWFILTSMAFVFSFYGGYILSFNKDHLKSTPKHPLSMSIFTPYVILLILAYYCAGVGFVVQATFFPDIINSLEGLNGQGNLGWLIVGFAGIPSAIFWMRMAYKFNSVDVIIVAFILQIIGILIPTFTSNMYLNFLSGFLYGSTFIGHVALFMHYGGKLAGKNPVVFMGAMTAAYGIGQVTSPLYIVTLFEKYGTYDMALYVTAVLVSFGIVFLSIAKRIKQ
jgi:predicted MFS family arabinose efflux permease